MTSSAVLPWNGASHGPPICLGHCFHICNLLLVRGPVAS
jgi:hypothetical protein